MLARGGRTTPGEAHWGSQRAQTLPDSLSHLVTQACVCADEVVSAQLDLTNEVLLGRQDYAVRSIDAVLGHEKWNVTYAQLAVLTPPRLAAPASLNSDHLLTPADSEAASAGAPHAVRLLLLRLSASFRRSDSDLFTGICWKHCLVTLITSSISYLKVAVS